MTAAELFTWCPFIALIIGAACTLGFFRSRPWGFGLVAAALFVQVVAWTILLLAGDIGQHGWTAEWNAYLGANFLRALMGVVPYTVIGAVAGGLMVALSRLSVRQEVEEAKEDGAGGKTLSRPKQPT